MVVLIFATTDINQYVKNVVVLRYVNMSIVKHVEIENIMVIVYLVCSRMP